MNATADGLSALSEFLDEGLVTAVLHVIKSGKEAAAYLCEGGGELAGRLAVAKVYHAREHRDFANDTAYQEGRLVLDARIARGLQAKSAAGRAAGAALWVDHEFETLSALHYAGADVPEVFAASEGAILMEYVGGEDGPAPQLQHATLARDEAEDALDRLLWNVECWLAHHVVHGDLSAFNILWDGHRPVAIDFPQAVDPRFAPAARRLLGRDLRNVAAHFRRYGLEFDPERHAEDLWRRFELGELG